MMSDTISEAVGTKSKSSLKDTATYHGFNLTSSILMSYRCPIVSLTVYLMRWEM